MELWMSLDKVLIVLYRITGNPVLDFFVGTFLLAFATVVIGEFTASIAYRLNRKHLGSLNNRMVDMNNASITALKAGEKEQFKATNKQANDAFGRVFFNAIALSAAFLWPIFFALTWMQWRFMDIKFYVPFTGVAANYVVVFLICYVLGRILFGYLRPRLPYFRQVQKMIDECGASSRKMDSLADLAASGPKS
ncbi:MAG: hypothetical protein KJ650_10105 [Firmicutes bacterium]|nr:hypothetical protein [Bacillota bacterium]MBV1726918.1 hypothetical protein [Desulforudis sp.]MBU4533961.1 hypothetical protein [Bacillota bacterium]MBU4554310.1 hypothetical protein [Bacillota bacterium]MBV1735649.1 hypothetical protein [Desulforudis sp.]